MTLRGRLHPLPHRVPGPFEAGRNRRCAHPGCITLLNGYNPGPECLIHTPAKEPTDKHRSFELELEAKRHARLVAP
jgi:hypothetical protein